MTTRYDSTDSTDSEERVLHYSIYVSREGSFTPREVAQHCNMHEGRVRAIALQLMNLEVFKRQRLHPEHVFSYSPTDAAMALQKVKKLHEDAAEIERQRKKNTAREVNYVLSR